MWLRHAVGVHGFKEDKGDQSEFQTFVTNSQQFTFRKNFSVLTFGRVVSALQMLRTLRDVLPPWRMQSRVDASGGSEALNE